MMAQGHVHTHPPRTRPPFGHEQSRYSDKAVSDSNKAVAVLISLSVKL